MPMIVCSVRHLLFKTRRESEITLQALGLKLKLSSLDFHSWIALQHAGVVYLSSDGKL